MRATSMRAHRAGRDAGLRAPRPPTRHEADAAPPHPLPFASPVRYAPASARAADPRASLDDIPACAVSHPTGRMPDVDHA